MAELTRKEFYNLAHECRDYAMRLATHDQDQVNRQVCAEYNAWLKRVRSYNRLEKPLARLPMARPITRSMVVGVLLLIWLLVTVFGAQAFGRSSYVVLISLAPSMIIVAFLVPPSLYGTSVEAIESHVLVVVEALQGLLESGDMEFTEAVYFNVRDVLREAAAELRQQVLLNRAASGRG